MEKDEIRSIISLLWYFTGNHALKYTGKWEKDWLNLKAFTNISYNSKNYFNLSLETQVTLKSLENKYREQLIKCEHKIFYEKN